MKGLVFLKKWTLNINNFSESHIWFLWSIVNKYHEYGVLEKVNIPCTYTDGRHRDIEGLCSECFKFLKAQPNKWIQHVCLHKGCQEGYVTVDGNCKLRRPICAAKGELEEIGPGLPKVFRCCPNTPILGNQSKKANTFCEEHMDDSAVGTPNADGDPVKNHKGNLMTHWSRKRWRWIPLAKPLVARNPAIF